MSRYIAALINEGEHQRLDFKHSVRDSKKIARSLAAFANTKGGRLLLGVKDNGNIVGVNSDEEYHMVEAAAQLYCKPEIPFEAKRWTINGKVVLEVRVRARPETLHWAPDRNGLLRVFFRWNDEDVVATPLQLRVWRAKRHKDQVPIVLSEKDQGLLDYLASHRRITVAEYSRVGFLPAAEAEERLVNLAVLGIVDLVHEGERDTFVLAQAD